MRMTRYVVVKVILEGPDTDGGVPVSEESVVDEFTANVDYSFKMGEDSPVQVMSTELVDCISQPPI